MSSATETIGSNRLSPSFEIYPQLQPFNWDHTFPKNQQSTSTHEGRPTVDAHPNQHSAAQ
ncbi:hypothetical protein K443DRAFT_677488 [Laccaria amethystina LaAM-08-1]|uniref:Uncharacterized protein n=1 Tax=Laccaria amethystina LaAM-08-1 TaxID=1095629 RepID=A0A0C9XLU8_9AGAR|nr:hypothetical protein K443DRAFT_677488 [Laccaria amethystina LaAM-08-1]